MNSCKVVNAVLKRKIKFNFWSVASVRRFVVSKQQNNRSDKIVSSKYNDVQIPNCSIIDYLWRDLDKWADKPALVCGISGKTIIYSQLKKMVTSFAVSLRTKLNVKDKECLGILLPNMPEYPVVALGALQAGCVVTTINPIYTAYEVAKQLEASDTKILVTNNAIFETALQAVKESKKNIPIVVVNNDHKTLPRDAIRFEELALNESIDTSGLKDVSVDVNDVAFLPYSSGTTGLPKGVELTHRNIIANCEQISEKKIENCYHAFGNHQDNIMCILPFFHSYGLTVLMMHKLLLGCKLITLPSFKPDTFLETQLKHKCVAFYVAPPIALFLGSHHQVTPEHFASLRFILNGAAPLAVPDIERVLEKSKNDKMSFLQGYGLTETSPVLSMRELGDKNYQSVGGPLPSTEMKVVSVSDSSASLGVNETGELWVRGPQVMKGYKNNDKANAEVFPGDGWFRTGDLANYDDNGDFYIVDRIKELIKVKGFQVAPAELEAILRDHPQILDAAVIGVPHPKWGEAPKAFLVAKPGQKPLEEDIKKFLLSKVSPFKALAHVQFIDVIPKSTAGKILRRELKNL